MQPAPAILYFLPTDKRAAAEADARAAGFGYAVDGRGLVSVRIEAGPAGAAGLLLAAGGNSVDLAYRPDNQTWRADPGGKFSVGVAKDPAARPGPEHLARSVQYEGQAVRLLDGREWIVPRCVGILSARPSTLPRVLDMDDDGRTITRPHPRYAALFDAAFRLWAQQPGDPAAKRLTPEEQVTLAADALGVNYRVGKLEVVGLLGLFGTDEFNNVLRAMLDQDEVEAQARAVLEKKVTAAVGASNT